MRSKWAAWGTHLFTASGAAAAFLALMAALGNDFVAMFAWLGLALFIDGVDGLMARAADVKTHAPQIDGDVLDLVVDYVSYVIVPLTGLSRSSLLDHSYANLLCAVIAAASALYFADRRMKTGDNWFRGFPALWNVIALYAFVFAPQAALTAALLALLTILMFAPIKFVHPMRVKQLNVLTVSMTMVWLASAGLAVTNALTGSVAAKVGLAVTGAYFVAISIWRSLRHD
jgi:phosphatidylcholine synthase